MVRGKDTDKEKTGGRISMKLNRVESKYGQSVIEYFSVLVVRLVVEVGISICAQLVVTPWGRST